MLPGEGAWWNWSDALTFIGVFVFIRIAFIWLATKAFVLMIPDGDRCPMCDGHTLPIERDGWWRILGPRFRRSWCLDCGWEGVLRRSESPPPTSGRIGRSARELVRRSPK
jgi:hypothetical protein